MGGSTLSHTNIGAIRRRPIPLVDSKKNLIDLTKKSLADEAKIVQRDKDYSYASTSWLPIKTYYLLFNMMMTIDYLFTLDPASFRISHAKCSEKFTRRLAAEEITFVEQKLNTVYDKSVFSHREAPGANLRAAIISGQHATQAMKKIAQYKLEEWMRHRKIPDFKHERHRQEKQKFHDEFRLSIFEFPYHMRLRANYRDFAFIDGVSSAETAVYFNDYFAFTRDFYRALQNLKNELVEARTH